jgi:HK97 family phage major capsid protein
MNVNEKLTERGTIIAQQRALNDKVLAEKRDFTAEEKTSYDKMEADANLIKAQVDRQVKLDAAEKDNAHTGTGIRGSLDTDEPVQPRATAEYKKNFIAWARHGDGATPMEIKATLEKSVNTAGGYVVPIDFETKIVLQLRDANIMRQLGTVIRTTSQVNIPMEGNLPTFGWIDELGTYPATDASFGQSILSAYKLGGIMTVSEELMDDAFLDIGDYISGRAALSASFAEEAAYIGGDGNKKPTGFLTTVLASGSTVTSIAPANVGTLDVFAMYYGLTRPYRRNASFVFADSAIKTVRMEKATTGQYIWQMSLIAGAPDTLLGRPVYTSNFLPEVAATTVSAAFGDFSYYQIVDRIGWSMQRLNELYAGNGQIGFRVWERTDGKLLIPAAIITLTQHS